MAKVAGTILWAPQIKLAEMQGSHHGQLSLQEAFQLVKKTVFSEGKKGGIWSLWSGYRTTLISLLPYTMLYFATYEKLKQFARLLIISREEQQLQLQGKASTHTVATGAGAGREIDYRTDRRPLDLGTYMACVAGAVAISAAVCHTAGALRVHIQDHWSASSVNSVSTVLSATKSATTSLIAPSSPSSSMLRTSGSTMTAKLLAPLLVVPATPQHHYHHSHLLVSAENAHATVTQHANMTTTTTDSPAYSPRRPLMVTGTESQLQRRKQSSSGSGGLLRRIGRGLGPRVMWTAPGVTLTTAGFEVLRNLALGVV
ncbi:hypothetical protein BG015_002205 [Linnemannia schmuckeri]|uniref:Mitochondrial carrier protein n=1 Tax=Linnemannia schmuckeri TaxID=64567 RepID=A0A9P5V6J9_9FUNG|nr:hypothetical protein BG015_002205 [Linnemannia schmuckeri]